MITNFRGSAALIASLILWSAISSATAAVWVVDPANPRSEDQGEGSVNQPLRSLGEAVRRIQPGDVLRIAPGIYRESLDLRRSKLGKAGASNAPTVIEGSGESAPVIKGSDLVTDWQKLEEGLFVRRNWDTNSQQVFVDGQPLKQIGGVILNGFPERKDHPLAKLHAGAGGGIWPGRIAGNAKDMPYDSFYYDRERRELYIRVNTQSLTGHEVEASVRPFLVIGEQVNNITLRNLAFRHANTTDVTRSGAITLNGDRLVLEQLDIQHVDGIGLSIAGNENIIHAIKTNYCGQLGINARGRNVRITDNEMSYNNTRGFNKWWEAGGAKFVGDGGLKNSVVNGNTVIGNNGDGIWFDWLNEDNMISANVAAYNNGFGIHYEASSGAVIRENQVFKNKQRGIYLSNSRDSRVEENLVVANGLDGIVAVDARNGKYGRFDLEPRNNHFAGNIVAWNKGMQITLPEADAASRSDHNLIVTEPGKQPGFSQGWGNRAKPARIGLQAWREFSGQDRQSNAINMAIPEHLVKAWETANARPDWSALLREKSAHTEKSQVTLSNEGAGS